MAMVGYARTSTFEQKAGLDDQVAELKKAGCEKVYDEQSSGVDAERPKLRQALDYCRDGDVFVVTKPDRLARSTADFHNIVAELTKKGVTVQIRSMGIDTGTPTGRLMVEVLAAIATFEREIMLERQRAGIRAAKDAGRYKGRAPTAQRKASEVLALRREGATVAVISDRTGISRASIYRILGAEAA